jgi:NADPH-dependent 2,4-dienoyl-CoA reductase/sulfur reductase-like enzyme
VPKDPTRYVIIGSGVAGISAAQQIRRADPAGQIVLVSDDPHGYYSRPGLAYYLTGEVEERFLFPFSEADFRRLGAQRVQARAERIDPAAHRVILRDGRSLPYDRLLVATGAFALIPAVPGIDLAGVVKLDHLEDARAIRALAGKARRAVVVGGGITALEIVEALVAQRVEVHYFLRGDRYWANVLDEKESRIIEQRLQHEGVRIHYQTELAEAVGQNGRLTAVRTKAGQTLPADLLAVAIGVQARVELGRASGLAVGKGIQVDDQQAASAPDVFAAGDAAETLDANGRASMNTLWSPARQQGHVAGINMAGGSARYTPLPPINVTRLAGLTTTIMGSVGGGQSSDLIGIARGESETWRQIPDAIVAQNDFEVNRLRLLVGERTLLGAVVMGDQTLSQAIQVLVARQVDISAVRAGLLSNQQALGDAIAAFWTQWRAHESTSPA